MTKVNGNQIRPGDVLLEEGLLWKVTATERAKPGKGGAYAQVDMVSLKNGTKKKKRFGSSESAEKAFLEEKSAQFSYSEKVNDQETIFYFMDVETFDQLPLSSQILGDDVVFLKESLQIKLLMHEGEVVSVKLPSQSIEIIESTEPVVKGQTAASSYKQAQLENGLSVSVPPHIKQGEQVIIDTQTREYIGRYKE